MIDCCTTDKMSEFVINNSVDGVSSMLLDKTNNSLKGKTWLPFSSRRTWVLKNYYFVTQKDAIKYYKNEGKGDKGFVPGNSCMREDKRKKQRKELKNNWPWINLVGKTKSTTVACLSRWDVVHSSRCQHLSPTSANVHFRKVLENL